MRCCRPLLLFHHATDPAVPVSIRLLRTIATDADTTYLGLIILLRSRLNLTMVYESCSLYDVAAITPS